MRILGLPLCPHCGARFFYRQVNRTKKNGEGVCPHCGGKFRIVYQKQRILLFLGVAAVAIVVNILLLWGLELSTVIPLYVATLLFVLLAFALVPFVVRYEKRLPKARPTQQKIEEKEEGRQKQKASARHRPEKPV